MKKLLYLIPLLFLSCTKIEDPTPTPQVDSPTIVEDLITLKSLNLEINVPVDPSILRSYFYVVTVYEGQTTGVSLVEYLIDSESKIEGNFNSYHLIFDHVPDNVIVRVAIDSYYPPTSIVRDSFWYYQPRPLFTATVLYSDFSMKYLARPDWRSDVYSTWVDNVTVSEFASEYTTGFLEKVAFRVEDNVVTMYD